MSILAAIHILILIHLAFTLNAFYNLNFQKRHTLGAQVVLVERGYGRLWTASLVHTDVRYFLLNMTVLLWFGYGIAPVMGVADFLFLYGLSTLGGSLITLYVCRHDDTAEAVGAAGGISGFIFASIALYPSWMLPLPGLAEGVPAWPIAIFFVAASVLGPRWYRNTMRHEAHLGGAMVGLFAAPLLAPEALQSTLWITIGILAPTVIIFYLYVKRPLSPAIRSWSAFDRAHPFMEEETSYASIEEEMDSLLDRISECGYQNLSDYEKERLQYISGGDNVRA